MKHISGHEKIIVIKLFNDPDERKNQTGHMAELISTKLIKTRIPKKPDEQFLRLKQK